MSHARVSLRAGVRLALGGDGLRSHALHLLVPVLVASVLGVVENRASGPGSIDRTLLASAAWVLPLTALSLVGRMLRGQGLRDALWPLARFGHSRRWLVTGAAALVASRASLAAIGVAAAGVLAASFGGNAVPSAVGLGRELVVSTSVMLLGATAYAAWLVLASSVGPRGEGRYAFVFADLLLGDVGPVSLVLPRGALAHLLGGSSPLELPQRASSSLLVAMTLAAVLLCGYRVRD